MTYPLPPRTKRDAGDFEVKNELGEGSLSMVHLAIERPSGTRYAMKIFDRKYLRSQHKELDVTMEEHCLRRLNHPGIVKLHASFRDGAAEFFALELCPGGDLAGKTKDVGCPDHMARRYLAQVLQALGYLRDAGVVHRDVKGENILLSASDTCKLVDFGSAKDLNNPHIKGAGTHAFKKVLEDNVGTPNFMAPEVIKNKFSDFRCDIWSFGCTVFQVVSGLPPFGKDIIRVYERAQKAHLNMPPGISNDARSLIRQTVRVDAVTRLGAANFRDLRAHPWFAALPESVGPGFEGAHELPAPVPTLAEICLRNLGLRWAEAGLGALARSEEQGEQLHGGIKATLARFKEIGRRTANKAAGLESSDGEPEFAPPKRNLSPFISAPPR